MIGKMGYDRVDLIFFGHCKKLGQWPKKQVSECVQPNQQCFVKILFFHYWQNIFVCRM